MRQVLHNYKLRLTNLSQRNRSLRLDRLSKRRDIDMAELGFLEKESPEQLMEKLIAGKDLRLLSRLDPRFEPANKADVRLNRIYREVNNLYEEAGAYDLSIGYPFVEGKFADGTIARCPVLLFPVRLIRDLRSRPRWKLSPIEDDPVTFNRTFFLAYEQFQQQRLDPAFWEEEIDPDKEWITWLNLLYNKIKEYEINVNFNSRLFDRKIQAYPDLRKSTMEQFGLGKLTFRSHAVLGIFPQSDSALLRDYEEIEKKEEGFEWDKLFVPAQVSKSLGAAKYIKEEERYFVTQVDESQEAALLAVKEGASLVLHGPPGTGKSQVIVNLIADALAHGKKVLLVSQKRAALDVVYKRLQALGLGRFAMPVHDYRYDRASIYRKLKQLIDDVPIFEREVNDLNITRWEHEYNILSRQADQYHREFEELHFALTDLLPWGISVHELYLNTDGNAQLLPVNDFAAQLDLQKLNALIAKLERVLEYREFFHPDYPWRKRVSFHHLSYDDRQRILSRLERLPEQILQIHQLWKEISPRLGRQILEVNENHRKIATFREIDTFLNDKEILRDLEKLYLHPEGRIPAQANLDKIEEILSQLDETRYIKDFHWRLYDELVKHTDTYDRLQSKGTRVLSLAYHQAKWFLKQLVKEYDEKLENHNFELIKAEVAYMQSLKGLYTEIHDAPFFEDFPLLSSQSEKYHWLQLRQKHLSIFQKIEATSFFARIKPKFNQSGLDRHQWQTSMDTIKVLDTFTRDLEGLQMEWSQFLHTDQQMQLREGIARPDKTMPFLEELGKSFTKDFQELKELDILLSDFSTSELEILEIVAKAAERNPDNQNLLHALRNSVYFYWIEHSERKYPVLVKVSTRGWKKKLESYANILAGGREKVTEMVRRRIKERIIGIIEYNRLKNPVTYRTIYHQVSKKRRLWSVRKLVAECWNEGLSELAPCWMASPESVAAVFPMEKEFFDLVIFDEASQCFVERGIPAVMRGKQCVIAGDRQQLQPMDLYTIKYEDAEAEFAETEIALEVESILDLAQNSFLEYRLNWHYRSQAAELINFSNHAFYEGKLQMVPHAKKKGEHYPPLQWISVPGTWQNNRNTEEAHRIVSLVEELIQREPTPSIGVVTFNYHQQELIRDVIDRRLENLATSNEEMYQKWQQAIDRHENEEFQGIFVKNIENVQGDERDIIIFSIGYAKNDKGKLSANFGLLNLHGGENRLNVAVTRARLRVIVVCSFQPGELQVAESKHDGPRLFKEYLQYVKSVSDGKVEQAESQVRAVSDTWKPPLFNPIAEDLARVLIEKGYQIEKNVGTTSYKVDLAVKSSADNDNYVLGIEIEGGHYFSGKSTKEREVYRPSLLQSKGWKVHRVWARNYWLRREDEIQEVLDLIKENSPAGMPGNSARD